MKKAVLIMSLILAIMVSGCQKKHDLLENKKEVAENKVLENVEIEESSDEIEENFYLKIDEVKKEGTNYEINLSIPSIVGSKADGFEEINKGVKQEISNYGQMIEDLANELTEEESKEFTGSRKLYAGAEFNLSFKNEEIFSVKGFLFEYTGGAHGGSNFANYTYSLDETKLLKLRDLFADGYEYVALITATIRTEVEKNPENYYEDLSQLEELAQDAEFYISKEGLVICLNTYAIAPYSSGPQEFLIKAETLKGTLNPKFEKIWNEDK
jgi:hypothetical protein